MVGVRREVRRTLEYERVAALPRRVISLEDAEAWSQVLTPMLLRAGKTGQLLPWQALALAECSENQGGLLGYPVGMGKTLIFETLPWIMKSHRSVLIMPAALREKTYAERGEYAKTWKLPSPPPRILSREELAPDSGAYLLNDIEPTLVMVDESDELSNPESSAVARIDRYVLANRAKYPVGHPKRVRVVVATGTLSRNSIMGYWHHLMWTHGYFADLDHTPWDDKGPPFPVLHSEMLQWASATDNKKGAAKRGRTQPGPLGYDIEDAQQWIGNRLAETFGVILLDGDSCTAPLTVRVRIAKDCPKLSKHFTTFMLEQENPGGIPVSTPLSRYLLDAQLGCGLYTYWDPKPPDRWMAARRAFCKYARNVIDAARARGHVIDTEGQVMKKRPNAPQVVEWQAVRHTFKEKTKCKWVSTATLESVRAWLKEVEAEGERGIVWCGGKDFLQRLADETKLPCYGPQGKEIKTGRGLHAADPTKHLIASWNANKRGFNLQAWGRMLIVHPPPSAKWLEQVIGRCHRHGRTERVVVDYLATSGGTLDNFDGLVGEAAFAKDTTHMTQKILRAEIVHAQPKRTTANRHRWAQQY